MKKPVNLSKELKPISFKNNHTTNYSILDSNLPIGASVIRDITGNCQLFCIYSFKNILRKYRTIREVKNVVKKCSRATGKRLMLIDVNDVHIKRVEQIFKTSIVIKTPYISTNSSNMCLFLIKVCDVIDYTETVNIQ